MPLSARMIRLPISDARAVEPRASFVGSQLMGENATAYSPEAPRAPGPNRKAALRKEIFHPSSSVS
jgi:hypothetical protein